MNTTSVLELDASTLTEMEAARREERAALAEDMARAMEEAKAESRECEPLSEAHEISAKTAENLEAALAGREGLLTPRAAAVELLHEFKLIACALWPDDRSTQDDLVQEMALGALQVRDEHEPGFYCRLGAWRARDYLRWWLIPMYKRKGLEPSEIEKKIDGAFERLMRRRIIHRGFGFRVLGFGLWIDQRAL